MSVQFKTQVLILGSGPGGYSTAFRCADLGLHTTIVERYTNLGGVCLNVGCIPSKALLHVAKVIKTYNNINKNDFFLQKNNINLNISKICSWKNKIINKLSNNLTAMAKSRGIKVINGFGEFINEHTLKVSNNQTVSKVIFDHAVIATGSHSTSLSFIPNDKRIWNSTDALTLNDIPKQLLIIGSGAIGLEMATIYHALGVLKIDVVEIYNQIMPILDKDVAHLFYKNINNDINIITNTKVKTMHSKTDGIYVYMQHNTDKNIHYTNRYDAVLIAIGRNPNSDAIGLKNIEIYTDKYGFISVDNQMKTNVSNIFAIGDVTGHPMLAHKSIYEGHIVAEILTGKKHYYDAKVIPSIVYTEPEIAWVGYTEKEAKIKNINYETATFPWTALGKAITADCTTGITKLIFDKKTHRIIGGAIIGSHASEIIGEITLAIEMGCDVEDITLTMHAHPTLYESITLAASIYNGSITDLPNLKI